MRGFIPLAFLAFFPDSPLAAQFSLIVPPQTLTFAPIPDHVLGDPPFMVTATASSGLTVTFSAIGNCTMSGATVTLTNTGSCSVTAAQPGNASFGPASLTRSFNISPAATSAMDSGGNPNPFQLGSPVAITVTATPSSVNGEITFYDGATVLGVVQPSSGVANLVTHLLGAGNHKVWAYCLGVSSNMVPVTVTALAETFFAFNQPGIPGIASALALGDVNGDGIPDIVVADYLAGAAGILLGNGQGNFSPAVEYAAGGQPKAIALADFNGDGYPDLVVANAAGASVLLGYGNGTFQPQVYYPQNAAGLAVAVSDFDGDGKADFAVALNNSQVAILLGNGDGTFRSAGTFAMNSHSSAQTSIGLVVEDFNGDGKPDLALTDGANNGLAILLGNGDGTFQSAASIGLGLTPQSIALGDFNGDGIVDLAVGFNGEVGVLVGNGAGGFFAPRIQPSTPGIDYVAVGDFNGDGKLDVAAASVQSGAVTILLGNGDGSLQSGTDVFATDSPTSILVADLNGDHKYDIVEGLANTNAVHVALSAGSPGRLLFTAQPAGASPGTTMPAVRIAVADPSGVVLSSSTAPVTLTSSPAGVTATVNAVNGIATFSSLVFNAAGTYTLTATSPGSTSATSNPFLIAGPLVAGPPSVFIDTPSAGAVLMSGSALITGWAIDNTSMVGTAITSVQVLFDGVVAGNATYGTSRADVCALYPGRPGCPNVGFSFALNVPLGAHTITVIATDSDAVPDTGSASVTVTTTAMPGSKVGIVRANQFNFDSDGNEIGPAPIDPLDRLDAFAPPGGVLAGDVGVVGDWNGDGHSKAGWFRASTGQWWLDANNDGTFDAGDLAYTGFGGPGDIPIVGDWAGLGKSAIGVVRAGFLWILDLNADGVFEQPSGSPLAGDAVFAFGAAGDVPVVGNWYGVKSAAGFPVSQAGMVRTYCSGNPCIPQGGPFLWLLDSGVPGTAANVTPQASHAVGNIPGIAFGGASTDQPVAGDWNNTGVYQFGDFREGFLWVLDGGSPLAPQNSHFVQLSFGYGGLSGDVPIVGKW